MDSSYDESVHALSFATRVRRIQLGAAQRNVTSKNLEETIKALTSEMKMLTKAKENSEHQLHSLKRDNTRIQERLQTISQSRALQQSDSRTLEVLRKNNQEMASRWQKEKNLREASAEELERCQQAVRFSSNCGSLSLTGYDLTFESLLLHIYRCNVFRSNSRLLVASAIV
jgi:predicted RNase H-like nuclease (RuvC/YqgF family)